MVNKSTSDLAITCRKGKDLAGDAVIVSKANGGVWGNLLVGGLIGYVVDSNSGAGFDYPRSISVQLRALDAAAPTLSTARSAAELAPVASKSATPAEPKPASSEDADTEQDVLDPKPYTYAKAPAPSESGQDSSQVAKLANQSGCGSKTVGKLTSKGAGFELYTITCASGDVWSYRCEFGNCRQLR